MSALDAVTRAVRAQSHAIGSGLSDRMLTTFDCAVVEARSAAMTAGFALAEIESADDAGFDLYCRDLGV